MAKNEGNGIVRAWHGPGEGDGAPDSGPGAEAGADYDAAYEHAEAGRTAEADAICRKILTSDPTHAEALHLLGAIAAKSGNAPSAIELFNRALAAKPDFAKAHSNLGALLLARDEAEEAVDHFEKAIDLEPNLATAHNNLGNALMRWRRFGDAEKAFEQAVQLEPENELACNNLGAALLRQGRADEAIARFEKATELDPNLAMAHNNLGNALIQKKNFEGAATSYRRALELSPDLAKAHSNLGTLLEVLGRYDEAEETLNRALDLNPDDTEARYNHAAVHNFVPGDPEIGKLQELLEREGMSEDQRNPLLFALGKAHDDIGLHAEAFSYYRQANEEMARRVTFNASHHRKEIIEIKRVFRDRRCPASGSSREVEHVPIFIVGMSRSGKTLVESLLSQHGDVFGAGESLEWKNAVDKVLDKYSVSESFPNCMGFLVDEQIREIGKIYMEVISKYSQESRFFVNTKPESYLHIGLILQALPFARVIYCHRDPLDNCLFIYFKRYLGGVPYSYDLRNIASYYADYQEMIAHWQRLYGNRILSVGYEDLVRNPVETGAEIYEYCGLQSYPTAIRFAFTTDEIGHWKHYEPYLGPLREALGGLAH